MTTPDEYMSLSGGRRACPHPAHRIARVPDNCPSRLILPECAGQEAWLKARQGGIGGSEVAALVGASEYDTPFSVYRNKKTGGRDLSDVPAVEWGHRLEEVVAAKTADMVGLSSRFAGGLWADREKEFLRVTPDRFACKPRAWRAIGVIECKTAGDDEYWISGDIRPGGSGSGSAPLSYQAQIQWQMGILGLPIGWLGCLVMGRERQFFVVEVHFDKDWFAEMTHAAEEFWTRCILGDELPTHDLAHPKTEALLKELHPSVTLPSVQLPEEAEEWLDSYREAKDTAEKATRRLNSIKNAFRMWTGDAGAGYLGDRKVVSYPEVLTSAVNVALLRERYPEVAEAVTVSNRHRRMTIRAPRV